MKAARTLAACTLKAVKLRSAMHTVSRRDLLQAATGVIAAGRLFGDPLGLPIGSQTYPHRQRIKDGDFAGLCKDLHDIGVRSIELCEPGYAEFASLSDGKATRKIIADHGLKCVSSHFTMKSLRTDQPKVIE